MAAQLHQCNGEIMCQSYADQIDVYSFDCYALRRMFSK